MSPSCFDHKAEYICEVVYNKWGDSDVLYLCAECRERLQREARRYGYRLRSHRVK